LESNCIELYPFNSDDLLPNAAACCEHSEGSSASCHGQDHDHYPPVSSEAHGAALLAPLQDETNHCLEPDQDSLEITAGVASQHDTVPTPVWATQEDSQQEDSQMEVLGGQKDSILVQVPASRLGSPNKRPESVLLDRLISCIFKVGATPTDLLVALDGHEGMHLYYYELQDLLRPLIPDISIAQAKELCRDLGDNNLKIQKETLKQALVQGGEDVANSAFSPERCLGAPPAHHAATPQEHGHDIWNSTLTPGASCSGLLTSGPGAVDALLGARLQHVATPSLVCDQTFPAEGNTSMPASRTAASHLDPPPAYSEADHLFDRVVRCIAEAGATPTDLLSALDGHRGSRLYPYELQELLLPIVPDITWNHARELCFKLGDNDYMIEKQALQRALEAASEVRASTTDAVETPPRAIHLSGQRPLEKPAWTPPPPPPSLLPLEKPAWTAGGSGKFPPQNLRSSWYR